MFLPNELQCFLSILFFSSQRPGRPSAMFRFHFVALCANGKRWQSYRKKHTSFCRSCFRSIRCHPPFYGLSTGCFARTTVENIPCRSLRVENAECGSVFGIRLFVYQPLGTRRDDEQILNGSAVQNPREYPFAFYPSGCCVVQTVCPFDFPFSHQRAEEIEFFGDSSTSFFAAKSSAKFFYQIHFDNDWEAIGVGQVFIYAR